MSRHMKSDRRGDNSQLRTEWWDRVIDSWNSSSYTQVLAGLGPVCFEVLKGNFEPVWIEWDYTGHARRLPTPVGDAPCFSATVSNWRAFIDGKFKAAIGVLTGRIKFHGKLTRIMPYANSFDRLAEVARSVSPRTSSR